MNESVSVLGVVIVEVVGAKDVAVVGERVLAEEGYGVSVPEASLLDAIVARECNTGTVAESLDLSALWLRAPQQHHLADLLPVVL